MNSRTSRPSRLHCQRGVVLIIAMVMLVVISLLASLSIRNALSSESVAGNVRTTELANQAAETALRVCEAAALAAATTTLDILPAAGGPRYNNLVDWWDKSPRPTGINVLGTDEVNTGGGVAATFKRMPECMIERVRVMNLANTGPSDTRTFVITARGFGPEVPDGTGRPDGTEVFLQSVLEVD